MELLILVAAMLGVGLLAGWLAGVIWKDERPLGVSNDYLIAMGSAVVIGLMDWYVIPALGFSDTLKYIGLAVEPIAGALFVLWLVRRSKQQ